MYSTPVSPRVFCASGSTLASISSTAATMKPASAASTCPRTHHLSRNHPRPLPRLLSSACPFPAHRERSSNLSILHRTRPLPRARTSADFRRPPPCPSTKTTMREPWPCPCTMKRRPSERPALPGPGPHTPTRSARTDHIPTAIRASRHRGYASWSSTTTSSAGSTPTGTAPYRQSRKSCSLWQA